MQYHAIQYNTGQLDVFRDPTGHFLAQGFHYLLIIILWNNIGLYIFMDNEKTWGW